VAASVPTAERSLGQFVLSQPGTTAEGLTWTCTPRCRSIGPGDARRGWRPCVAGPCTPVEFPGQTLGPGLGALGAVRPPQANVWASFWPLAAPPSASPRRDTQARLHAAARLADATVQVAVRLVGRGGLGRLLRFDKGPEQTSVPLSVVVQACLGCVGSDAVGLAMVAETAALVGAGAAETPGRPRRIRPAASSRFPTSATAELHGRSRRDEHHSLIVGLAAQRCAPERACVCSAVGGRSGKLHGPFSRGGLSYRPAPQGRVELTDTVGHCSRASRCWACSIC